MTLLMLLLLLLLLLHMMLLLLYLMLLLLLLMLLPLLMMLLLLLLLKPFLLSFVTTRVINVLAIDASTSFIPLFSQNKEISKEGNYTYNFWNLN